MSGQGIYGYRLGGRLILDTGVAAGIEAGRNAGRHDLEDPYRATVHLSVRW